MAEVALPERWRIDRRAELPSTQAALRAELESGGEVHGLVIRAQAQTQGRGRLECPWSSGPGGSYQSLALRDDSGRLRSSHLPLAIAVAVADVLTARGPDVALKWPNDIFLRERAVINGPVAKLPGKVGGVLCHYLRGHLLVGVGVNVANEVPPDAAALSELEPDEVSDLVLEAVAGGVRITGPELPERYSRFDLLAGRRLKVSDGRRLLAGTACGVGSGGCLQLETMAGKAEVCGGRIEEIEPATA